jgi:hypothetical protein
MASVARHATVETALMAAWTGIEQLNREVYVALVRLHDAESHALHVLHDAEQSLAAYDALLVTTKTHLRALGYRLD